MPSQNSDSQLPLFVQKYIGKFGFSKWLPEVSSTKLYNNIIVIPAIQEFDNLEKLFGNLSGIDSSYFGESLFLVVINNPENSSYEIKADNQKSCDCLRSIIKKQSLGQSSADVTDLKINIAIVDASSPGFEMPEKDGGVGYARKIGMDLALTLFDYNSPRKRILICLDADCEVQQNYLTAVVDEVNQKNISAGYVEYEHKLGESDQEKIAIITYEIFLRYYVLGLKLAKSPFAIDTIGSTMICDAESYIRIGGMNKRKAAEDFYFMEKLSKITEIRKIESTRIFPSSRRSWRVPFGTGQRINRYFAGSHNEFILIDPRCFRILKEWLELFLSERILEATEYLDEAKNIHPALYEFLVQQLFEGSWNKILIDTKKKDQLQKQKIFWFDAFHTMKLIHHLRDNAYPMINMFEALDEIFAEKNIRINRSDAIPGWQVQLEYLNVLRNYS